MRTIRLREYETSPAVALTRAEVDGLRLALQDTVAVTPTSGAEGLYDLRPGSTVGAVTVGGLRCLVAPKIAVGNLAFLLGYGLDRVHWSDSGFDLAEEEDLVEAIVPALVRQVRRALRHGVLYGYRSHDEALPIVRGQIRMSDQMRARYRMAPPIEVRYDEFSPDILENRLLRAALHKLSRLRARSDSTTRALREFDRALAEVQLVDFHPRAVPQVVYTRLNAHYRAAVELARLVLRGGSWDLEHGAVVASAFPVDMNAAFEDFVAIALREALGLTEREFPRGQSLALDRAGRVRMAPDLSWWRSGACVFVGDVKYKRTSLAGFRHRTSISCTPT